MFFFLSVTFNANEVSYLILTGYEAGTCNGCACSGLQLYCTGAEPWNSVISSKDYVLSYGSNEGYPEDLLSSAIEEPCISTSGFNLLGNHGEPKLWASGGEKYAVFYIAPTISRNYLFPKVILHEKCKKILFHANQNTLSKKISYYLKIFCWKSYDRGHIFCSDGLDIIW